MFDSDLHSGHGSVCCLDDLLKHFMWIGWKQLSNANVWPSVWLKDWSMFE
jgi:hypothetical protein